MGTALMRRGLSAGQSPESYTLDHPDAVADIHRSYVVAGARILKTNTFNANRFRLEQAGLEDRLEDCNRVAVTIAKQAAGEQGLVAGVLGPTGAMLAPAGTGTEEEFRQTYLEQASILASAGADVFLIETMYDVREALAALTACKQAGDKPVLVTMTFSRTKRGFLTMMGDTPQRAFQLLADAGAFAVGANCNLDSRDMVRLAADIRDHTSKPILIQPCAGQPQTHAHGLSYPDGPDRFAENTMRIVKLGVEMVGGCCGTTDEYIRRLATMIDTDTDTKGATK